MKQIDRIDESICLYRTCQRCLEMHRQGRLTFVEVEEFVDDRGKSCLFRLKQMCHDVSGARPSPPIRRSSTT
jgi:hypothetical protein